MRRVLQLEAYIRVKEHIARWAEVRVWSSIGKAVWRTGRSVMKTRNEHKTQIETLGRMLGEEPENVVIALQLWEAMGNGPYSIQSGVELIRVFREPALNSVDGVVALATAYYELAILTGETPRAELLGDSLSCAIHGARQSADNAAVEWLCQYIVDCRRNSSVKFYE